MKNKLLIIALAMTAIQANALCKSSDNSNSLLTRKTTQEQNTHHFAARKSKDGINRQAFATIAAAGNSTKERSYSMIDLSTFP